MLNILLFLIIAFITAQSLHAHTPPSIAYIFAHGLGGDKNQINWYKKQSKNTWYIIPKESLSFDFPDVAPQGFNKQKVNLAQEGDIDALEKEHKTLGSKKVVLIGVSRGAATVLNYAAFKQPKNIKAIIAEAPFDQLESVISHIIQQNNISEDIITQQWKFGDYKPNGIKPINIIDKIDKEIPILFIHSKQDKLVPFKSSQRLFDILKKIGHKHVYLLKLPTGEHANYQSGSSKDIYQTTVHAFYKKYDIPHNALLAARGKKYLEIE